MDLERAMEVADSQIQTMEEHCERAAVNKDYKPRARMKFGNKGQTINLNTKAQRDHSHVHTVGSRICTR